MELTPEQQQAINQQKEHCPFCQIIAGKIPSEKVYEDEYVIAILDINPAAPGHVLVMPKEHYPIMPLIPEKEFTHLFSKTKQLTARVRKAMLTPHTTTFVANGQVAGQQTQHFMIHIIPSDKPLSNFSLPSTSLSQSEVSQAGQLLANNLPLMMRKRTPLFPLNESPPQSTAPSELAQMIQQHPELRQAIINNPEEVLLGLEENPSLKPLFEGVDIHALSKKLAGIKTASEPATTSPKPPPQSGLQSPTPSQDSQTTPLTAPKPSSSTQDLPAAVAMQPHELVAFIDQKEALRSYLLEDIESLEQAIPEQPRLATFFRGTSPQEVRDRYLAATTRKPPRRFGGGDAE